MVLENKAVVYKRTRLAPTPSGFLHLGNVLSFAITAAIAKKTGAKIVLRIDDLDRARSNELYIQDIFDTLTFLEVPWDEGPRNESEFESEFSQLHRMGLYNETLKQLANEKLVYACACSRSQLSSNNCDCQNQHIPLSTPDVSWRLITGDAVDVSAKTYKGVTITQVLPAEMQNFIVRKKDGYPAYQLASVVDDLYYGVDLIVRGEDLWASTLAQLKLAAVLKKNTFQNSTFYHHHLLSDASGAKLSKTAGSTSVKYLRESGKTGGEIYSLIGAMLGIQENVDSWQQLGERAVIIP